MARDYKNRSSRKGDGGSRFTGFLTFCAGVVTGVCAVVIVYLVNGIPELGNIMERRLDEERSTASPAPAPATATDSDKADRKADQSAPTPRFDFYTILPEMEVSVPEWESENQADAPAEAAESESPRPAGASERYILQIGSFRQPDEAERVKAQLALLGIETEIQRVVIDGGDVWHRVRAGPYQSTSKLNQTRQRLIENDIDFMLLKLKQENG